MSIDYDIVVVGAGVTAGAALQYLKNQSDYSILCVAPEMPGQGSGPSASMKSAGYVVAGAWDNFTRLSHAHGPETAEQLTRFGAEGFARVRKHCQNNGIEWAAGKRCRILTSAAERTEAEQAVREMAKAGLQADLVEAEEAKRQWGINQEQSHGVQRDPGPAACLNRDAFLASLFQGVTHRSGVVTAIQSQPDRIVLTLADSDEIGTRAAVLACHLEIGDLIPNLSEALVSYADQWHVADAPKTDWPSGTVLSCNHTYEWAVKVAETSWHLGGSRYLRPLAGFEAEEASFETKIQEHCQQRLSELLAIPFQSDKTTAGEAVLGCRPCDELPIIGPMYGESRLLVATGYMGTGLSMGFLAGECLAELLLTGKAPELPRILWPERLRSLAES